jgi:hypothetical protein
MLVAYGSEGHTMTVGVTSEGRAYAYCEHCGEFETRDSSAKAQRWLDRHFNFVHAGFGRVPRDAGRPVEVTHTIAPSPPAPGH